MDIAGKNICQDGFFNAEGDDISPAIQPRGGMTPEQYCYWLQGFFENVNPQTLDAAQTESIRNHLATVFKKVTPQFNSSTADQLVC